ncbi:MAG TPA: GatB/YqeY domain-containing protein [Candidatus Eisenbacteria bacterium]|nr:GatB/YqeY domain-containing protein [Candidatus Eisenbacteria bacterium]
MLEERLNEDMKNSLKSGQQDRLQTLRMMRSQILLEKKKDASIDLLPDPQVLQTLTSYAKKLRETAAEYDKLGQKEAATKIQAELAVVQEYLPAPLTQEETRALILDVIREVGATSPKDFGRVMKEATARAQGRADGKALSELVRASLG